MNSQEKVRIAQGLSQLKAGDKVGYYGHIAGIQRWMIRTVERVTDKMIVVGSKKFYQKDGSQYGGSKWFYCSICPLQVEVDGKTVAEWIVQDELEMQHNQRARALAGVKWEALDIDTVSAVYALTFPELEELCTK